MSEEEPLYDNDIFFKKLKVYGWRQFSEIEIDFHDRLTVLTGANGAGKSSIIGILSTYFGWSRQYLSTPVADASGRFRYRVGLKDKIWKKYNREQGSYFPVGLLSYSNNHSSSLHANDDAGVQYGLHISEIQTVHGFHINSHKVMPNYVAVSNIPTVPVTPENAYSAYYNETINRINGFGSQSGPVYRMKEALIAMAAFGEGNKYLPGDRKSLNAFLGFIEILKKVLPEEVGFTNLSIRIPDVVVETKSGDFLIDAASGGLMTLIDIAWHIHMYSLIYKRFTVCMDEPENHLHPSMQRSLMPSLLAAFPDARFVVATHSPFIVSSVRDSNVYVLRYLDVEGEEKSSGSSPGPSSARRVSSVLLDALNKAGSANEILRDVLGVDVTFPDWVEKDVETIVDAYRRTPLTIEVLNELRAELSTRGLGEIYPKALSKLLEAK